MAQYTMQYFDIYSDYADEFAIINFVTIVVTSIASNLLTGVICDWLERSYFFAKPMMCILKAVCGIIACMVIFLV